MRYSRNVNWRVPGNQKCVLVIHFSVACITREYQLYGPIHHLPSRVDMTAADAQTRQRHHPIEGLLIATEYCPCGYRVISSLYESSCCRDQEYSAKFCPKNKSIVNAIKSKCMIFGQMESAKLYFNGDALERVNEYKYVGNIVRSVTRSHCDVFALNYEYLYDKAKRCVLSMKTKTMGPLSPKISVYLFDSLIRPFITNGGAIWGSRLTGRKLMD